MSYLSRMESFRTLFFLAVSGLVLCASASLGCGETGYEDYCFEGLRYFSGSEGWSLGVGSFQELTEATEVTYFCDSPLKTLEGANAGEMRVVFYADSESGRDVLFYYTDAYGEGYEFLGCALSWNDVPGESVCDIGDCAEIGEQVDSSKQKPCFFQWLYEREKTISTETLVLNGCPFKVFSADIRRTSFGGQDEDSLSWRAKTIFLSPYVEDSAGKNSWDGYLNMIANERFDLFYWGLDKSILKEHTTWLEHPGLERMEGCAGELKPPSEGITPLMASRMAAGLVIAFALVAVFVERMNEARSWGGDEDE